VAKGVPPTSVWEVPCGGPDPSGPVVGLLRNGILFLNLCHIPGLEVPDGDVPVATPPTPVWAAPALLGNIVFLTDCHLEEAPGEEPPTPVWEVPTGGLLGKIEFLTDCHLVEEVPSEEPPTPEVPPTPSEEPPTGRLLGKIVFLNDCHLPVDVPVDDKPPTPV